MYLAFSGNEYTNADEFGDFVMTLIIIIRTINMMTILMIIIMNPKGSLLLMILKMIMIMEYSDRCFNQNIFAWQANN